MPKKNPRRIGLAIIGGGRVGLFRGEVAARHPQVDFIGLAELKPDRRKEVGEKIRADFVTQDYRELLARPEVTAAIIATDEHLHVEPILAAVERKLPLLIEKPLATGLADSERVLAAIQKSGVDAVVGYTQRFRRRWLVAKEKVRTGQLGDVTLVTSRAFMNRLVALDNYKRTDDPSEISPMVISGTHALDVVMWMMEAKRPVEVYARSVDKALGPLCGGIDATALRGHVDDGGEAPGGSLCPLGGQGAGAAVRGHRRDGGGRHLRGREPLSRLDILGLAEGLARCRVQPGGGDSGHRRRPHHRRYAPRHRARDEPRLRRRLRTGCGAAGRFSRQLSSRRRRAGRAARPDARGN